MISDRIRLVEDTKENEALIDDIKELAARYPFDEVGIEIVPALTGYRTLRITPEVGGRSVSSSIMLRPEHGRQKILTCIEEMLERWKHLAEENFLSGMGPKPGGKILENVGFKHLKN